MNSLNLYSKAWCLLVQYIFIVNSIFQKVRYLLLQNKYLISVRDRKSFPVCNINIDLLQKIFHVGFYNNLLKRAVYYEFVFTRLML